MVHKTEDILYTAAKTPKLYISDSCNCWLQQRLQRTCETKPSVQQYYQHGITSQKSKNCMWKSWSTTWWTDLSGHLYDSNHYPTITDKPVPSEHATGCALQPVWKCGEELNPCHCLESKHWSSSPVTTLTELSQLHPQEKRTTENYAGLQIWKFLFE